MPANSPWHRRPKWIFDDATYGAEDRRPDDHDRQRLRKRPAHSKAYRDKFTGKDEQRTCTGIGHNVPREAPRPSAEAIVDIHEFCRPRPLLSSSAAWRCAGPVRAPTRRKVRSRRIVWF
ncbi:hypothetical protein AB0F91_21215 [Amycolatopsis sp. NPDC023774]|uniref:hypothetical protein n=1 Tax=Amycolatopsis sp. NPDC023774 TaxID=3155015 RepID=UPI0033D773A7